MKDEILKLKRRIEELENKLYSARSSATQYRLLYEKERDCKEGKAALRESDKTKLLAQRDYINDLLGRWDKI